MGVTVSKVTELYAESIQNLYNYILKFFDWLQFLSNHFKVIPGITSYHIFCLDHQFPGVAFVRKQSQSPEHSIQVLKTHPSLTDHPQQIFPKGLDIERQWHLYEKIRQLKQFSVRYSILYHFFCKVHWAMNVLITIMNIVIPTYEDYNWASEHS